MPIGYCAGETCGQTGNIFASATMFPGVGKLGNIDRKRKAIELHIWAWQLIKGKFNFEISMFNLSWMD
jgi:hypothetical protein